MPGTNIPVVLRHFAGRHTDGTMDVEVMPMSRRFARALGALGLCWLAAVFAFLVPLLHWLLVPGITLLGPVVALVAFGRERRVCGGGGPCPVCATPIRFSASAHPDSFGQSCSLCRSSFQVSPAAAQQ